MNKKRIQLTLFIDEQEAKGIEMIRQEFNPEQYRIIKSHVTLCREDELEQLDKIIETLTSLDHPYLPIHFGNVIRFSEGKGVLLPVIGDNLSFHQLRNLILQNVITNPRKHEPHLTLMHPRNSTCTDSIFEQIQKIELPRTLIFRKISLIEQEEGKKWNVLREFELKKQSDI